MRGSGSNRRGKSYPSPLTKEKKKKEEDQKGRNQRAKCRKGITNRNSCNGCSMASICSREATQDWLKNQDKDDEVEAIL